jgi:hypothetical protein
VHEEIWEGDDGDLADVLDEGGDAFVDIEGMEPPADELEEIAAVTAAEANELLEARAALEAERERTHAELVHGASLEELDASMAAARSAVADISARLSEARASTERGFPVGAPARGGASIAGMSASEKIRRGLEVRIRG